MTTRARRRQAAKRAVRWRKQAARLIDASQSTGPRRHGADRRIVQILRGDDDARFDVALARTYCKRLLAEAVELDMQREVFADWTRMRGMGPENRDGGAFVSPAHYWRVDFNVAADAKISGKWSVYVDDVAAACTYVDYSAQVNSVSHTLARLLLDAGVSTRIPQYDSLIVSGKRVTASAPDGVQTRVRRLGQSEAPRGGWPGKLAHEYVAFKRAKRKCSRRDCDGGRIAFDCTDCDGHEDLNCDVCSRTGRCSYVCPECERFDMVKPSRTFANGGNLRRAAQRLLDTLDGRCPWNDDAEAQPDGCLECAGWVTKADGGICTACSGTGHNLRGTLPPLPEATRRKLQHDGRRLATRIAEHIQATLAANLGMSERLLFPERNTRTPVEMPAEFASGGMLHYFDITDLPTATDPVRHIAFAGRVEAIDLSSVTLFPEDPT